MSSYTPTGKPEDNTRGISKQVRDEFVLLQTAVNSKSDLRGTTSTSTTSIVIGTGTKSLTIESDKELIPGMTVFIADAAAPPTNNMTGTITSYNSTTGALVVDVSSVNGSGTKTSWLVGLSNPSGVTLSNNTFTGYQNFARATVASHATTADIWNAAGNQIDFTGVAIVTAFPDAPQAGASRVLICAAACSFTAGANILIDGYSSGETVTCAANDIIIVQAVSVTQFRLTRIRYDGLEQKPADHEVRVSGANGRGATNTAILRYTTEVRNVGTDITYADSAADGASFTINKAGTYAVFMVYYNSTAIDFGASVNSNQLTTSIASISASAVVFIHSTQNSSQPFTHGFVRRFAAGDVIRPHDEGTGTPGGTYFAMEVVKLKGI